MATDLVHMDLATLRRLYVDDGQTMLAIAAHFGCGETTVRRRLASLSIRSRHRGPQRGRRYASSLQATPPGWSADVAYIAGLMATDGNLSRRHGRLALSSNDTELLDTARQCLGLRTAITPYTNGRCHHLQWTDHDWLLAVGLTPAKSLTLGELAIPDEYFRDFLRGCVDGDGTILLYTDRYHVRKNARYIYQRLYVKLVSASRTFIEWVQATTRRLLGIAGAVDGRQRPGASHLWTLKYAKRESIRLLHWIYYDPDLPSLARKRRKAAMFLRETPHARRQ